MTEGRTELRGRLVLDDRVVPGRVVVEDYRIASVDLDEAGRPAARLRSPISCPASSTSTSTAGAATPRWVPSRTSTGWPGPCSAAA